MGKLNRILFGGIIGMMAGFSFQLAVLPFMAESLFPQALGDVYASMNPNTFWLVLVWLAAGAAAAYVGGIRRGSQIFAAGGLVAGALYGLMAMAGGSEWTALLLSAGIGAFYGLGAGALVGGGFGPAVEN